MYLPELYDLRKYLLSLQDRTAQQEALLQDLNNVDSAIGGIIGKSNESLSMSDGYCPACGRPL